MLYPGDKAPDLLLKTIEGQDMALADMWRNGRNTLLVFLRHLA
jgi:hypothetical protein